MRDSEVAFLLIAIAVCILLVAAGVSNGARDDAIENCIKANSDWTVATAHDYCNSVIREGKRP